MLSSSAHSLWPFLLSLFYLSNSSSAPNLGTTSCRVLSLISPGQSGWVYLLQIALTIYRSLLQYLSHYPGSQTTLHPGRVLSSRFPASPPRAIASVGLGCGQCLAFLTSTPGALDEGVPWAVFRDSALFQLSLCFLVQSFHESCPLSSLISEHPAPSHSHPPYIVCVRVWVCVCLPVYAYFVCTFACMYALCIYLYECVCVYVHTCY